MKDAPPVDLRSRTKAFALDVIRFYSSLPKTTEAQVLGRQLLRAATSVGTHYREAHRGRSNAEFISKIEGGLQELEEACYYLELLTESGMAQQAHVEALTREADELMAILVTAVRNVKQRNGNR